MKRRCSGRASTRIKPRRASVGVGSTSGAPYGGPRVLPARVMLARDPTDIEPNKHFGGAGMATRKHKMRSRNRRMTTVETRVHGFRLTVVMELRTRIPVAAKLVQIQENGIAHWQELIIQARANLAPYVTVETIVANRECMAGALM